MMTDVRMDRSRTESIVGRDVELEVLLRSAAGSDQTRMVLLSGDAGVGKTRLLTEAIERLTADGWRALVGHCLDFGETSMPYLPFAEMLAQVGEAAPELVESELHPALARLRHRAPADEPSEGLDRAEVFEAMYALVEDLAAARPLLLVVEDAHWADASTRDLISFLLSRRIQGRFLFLVTFRSDEMHRRHPLRSGSPSGSACPGVERVQLDPLPAGAVRGMVEQIIGRPGEPLGEEYDDDIARIVQRSQGNAFYVEELVGAFLGGGWSLPEDLADLLLVRLDRLDESARDVVRVASAAGQRVPARPARPGRAGDRGPARGGAARRRSTPTCSCAPATRSTPSATRCSARRSTTTCCPASGCGCTRRTPRRCASSTAAASRPTWRGTRSPPTTCPPPCRPASRPATRRWPPVDRTRRPGTTRRPWRSTRRAATAPRRPARRGRAGRPHRRRPAAARAGPETALALIDSHLCPAPGGRPAPVPGPAAARPRGGAALHRDRRAARAWSAARRSSWSGPNPRSCARGSCRCMRRR